MKKWNKGKKIIIIIILLVLAIAFSLYFFKARYNTEQNYVTDAASISDISSSISLKGTIRGLDERKVYSDSLYKILKINVEKGDKVKKNQVLATFDIVKLQQQYDIANIDYEIAKKYYSDTAALYENDAISQNALYEAEMNLKKAELVLKSYDIDNAGKILSPIDGVVSEINCSEGGYASFSFIQQPAFVIEDRSKLKLKTEVKEKNLSTIYVGQKAEITFEVTGNEIFSGTVSEIGPSGKVNQINEETVIPVTIEIEDEKDTLMTGITGKAKLITTSEKTMTVSIDAVSEKDDETCVYVLKDDKTINKVVVETGINDGDRIQIVSGDLKEGANVIIDPDEYEF